MLTEEWNYDMTLFIADFGGSLGFLLGVSILSVLEIVEGLTISGYELYRRSKMGMKGGGGGGGGAETGGGGEFDDYNDGESDGQE